MPITIRSHNSTPQESEAWLLPVKVTPKSATNQWFAWTAEDEQFCLQIKGLPEKGQVNHTLIGFIAQQLCYSKVSIRLFKGTTSRQKMILVVSDYTSLQTALKRLADYTGSDINAICWV